MKYFNFIFIIIISFSIQSVSYAQEEPDTSYYHEPDYTCGNKNFLRVKAGISSRNIEHRIIEVKSRGDRFIQTGGDSFWIDCLPRDNGKSRTPFAHGNKYGYYFKYINNKNQRRDSPTTYSIQDLKVPAVSLSTTPTLRYNKWLNTQTFSLNCIVRDSAGIQWICLYRKTATSGWIMRGEIFKFDDEKEDGSPDSIQRIHTFNDTVPEDNRYFYFIGAKDASYTPESYDGNYHFSGNERVPANAEDIEISVDTLLPTSHITNTNERVNSLTICISYKADDPFSLSNNIRSGLETVVLKCKELNKEWPHDADSIDTQFIITVGAEGYYNFFTLAYDSAGNVQDSNQIKIYTVLVDTTGLDTVDFTLADQTLADTLEKRIFKAAPGWTNSLKINATIEVDESNISDLDFMYFYGDVETDTVCNVRKDTTIELTLKDKKDLNFIYAQAQDFAGNRMHASVLKTIYFDNTKPNFLLTSPDTDRLKKMILPDTYLYKVQLIWHYDILELPAWYYAWIDDQPFGVKKEFHQGDKFSFRKDLCNKNFVSISAILIDSAGNSAEANSCCTINVPPAKNIAFCNVPNPFNLNTHHETQFVLVANVCLDPVIEIYDTFGNLVTRLTEPESSLSCDPTYHLFSWNGKNGNDQQVSEGIYLAVCPAVTKERIKVLVINR